MLDSHANFVRKNSANERYCLKESRCFMLFLRTKLA